MTVNYSIPILFVILYLFACFFAGNLFRSLFYREGHTEISDSCTIGFTMVTALCGIIFLIIPDNHIRTMVIFIIILLISAIGLISFLIARDYKSYIKNESRGIFIKVFWCLLFAIILFLSITNTCLHISDESFRAFLPLLILPLSFMSFYRLSDRLFYSSKRRLVFLYLLILVFLFSGFSENTFGTSLLLLSHDDFTAFTGIIFPLIISWFLDIYREKASRITYIKLAFALLSGAILCPAGAVILPVLLLSLIIPLIIAGIINGYASYSLKTFGFLIISYIPGFIAGLFREYPSKVSPINMSDWREYFSDIFSLPMVIPMILGFLFILMTNKEKRMKLMFGGMVAILFLTILNPLLIHVTSTIIPGEYSYIKIYFLVPTYIFIAFSGTFYCFMFARLPLNITAALIICVGIALFGRFVYTPENLRQARIIKPPLVEATQFPEPSGDNIIFKINFYEEYS